MGKPEGHSFYNEDFPVTMEKYAMLSEDGLVKTVEVELDDDVSVEVEMDEKRGPIVINPKDGQPTFIYNWPVMTSTERKVALNLVAKQNYRTTAGLRDTVKIVTADALLANSAGPAYTTNKTAGKRFQDLSEDIEDIWLSTRSSFGSLSGMTNFEPKPRSQPVASKKQQRDSAERPYDIIIYGATGFTGCLMVEHLDALISQAGSRCTWAIAGRSEQKLVTISKKCKAAPAVIKVSSTEELRTMASQGKVIVAAAGPFHKVGEKLIQACVEKLAHYIDVSGEFIWMHDMINKYDALAKEKGIAIVHASGQVCVPDDLNCYLLAQRLGPLKSFREYAFQYGTSTGGSMLTAIVGGASMSAESFEASNDPFTLGGRRKRGICQDDGDCKAAIEDPLYRSLFHQESYGGKMAARMIRRSCQLFEERPQDGCPQYGESLVVTIRDCALNQASAMKATAQAATTADEAKSASKFMQEQVDKGHAPPAGWGPPPEYRKLMFSDFYAVAESETGEWAHVHYTGPEAYEVTAMTSVTGALVLVEELAKQTTTQGFAPVKVGGVLSPAVAFHGTSYIYRLQACAFACGRGRKMSFKVQDGIPSEDDLKAAISTKSKIATEGEERKLDGKVKGWALPELLS